jgi:hypothetical protein
MVMWGLTPGPLLFIEQPDFVWGLISSLYTANVAAVLINIALIPVFVWALRMPFTVLCSIVLVLCIVGGYAPSQKMHDVWLILGFGVAGYLLRKADYPLAPLVLALVLGPLMERSFRQTLIAEQGNVLRLRGAAAVGDVHRHRGGVLPAADHQGSAQAAAEGRGRAGGVGEVRAGWAAAVVNRRRPRHVRLREGRPIPVASNPPSTAMTWPVT